MTLLNGMGFGLIGWTANDPGFLMAMAGLALGPGLVGTAYWSQDKQPPRLTGFLISSWLISGSMLLIWLILYILTSPVGGLRI